MWVEDFTGKTLTNSFEINSEDQYPNYTYVYDFSVNNNVRIADPIISAPAQWNTLEAKLANFTYAQNKLLDTFTSNINLIQASLLWRSLLLL